MHITKLLNYYSHYL